MRRIFTITGNINILFHVLIWSILIFLPYLVSSAENAYKIGKIPGLVFSVNGIIHIAIFYGNAYYLYPKLLDRRNWWLYLVCSVLLIMGSFQLKYFILTAGYPELLNDLTAAKFIFGPSIAVYIVSIVYRRVIEQNRSEQEWKERQAKYVETELKFLRSQVNPHFLFNVLTNLVSLARKKSDKLEPSLIMLSGLMRYMIYDTQDKRVTLGREIEYLDDYIALQKLRMENDRLIDFHIDLDDEADSYTIEPMLLIPFVENALKHSTNEKEDSRIDIKLSLRNGVLIFMVRNSYDNRLQMSKDSHSGIGLTNVRDRLDLLYKDNYTLTLEDREGTFCSTLILTIV